MVFGKIWTSFRRKSSGKGGSGNAKAPKQIPVARLLTKYFADSKRCVSVTATYGLLKFTVQEAELSWRTEKEKYFCIVSIGSQSLVSKSIAADAAGHVCWDASSNLILQRGGASLARVAIYRVGRLDGAMNNNLQCWASLDLANFFSEELAEQAQAIASEAAATSGSAARAGGPEKGSSAGLAREASGSEAPEERWVDLADPAEPSRIMGRIRVAGCATSVADVEKQLWRRLLPLADLNGDGTLELSEFTDLLRALGSDLSEEEVAELFEQADTDGTGTVNTDELSELLTSCHERGQLHRLVRQCPVDGAELPEGQDLSNMLYILLAMDEAAADVVLKGGYVTPQQASRAWVRGMSEWITQPLAGHLPKRRAYTAGGPRVGGAAGHILVYDRANRLVVEERLSGALVLAMRNMYQSRAGRISMREGAFRVLTKLSDREGKYADSAASAKDILPFISTYRQEINVEEFAEPPSAYATFNQFFYRKLKQGVRPVAAPDDARVVVSAADCRLMVYANIDDATRCWIKGRSFSLAGLLAAPPGAEPPDPLAAAFSAGASMAIFRLAPQDYHRFHSPVAGVVRSVRDVPGPLMTVNPIAVNSQYANVFTLNKRSIMAIDTPRYGLVAFVAIGATIVGSINWTVQPGQAVTKGQELGYFAFGGSTCVLLLPPGAVQWDADLQANSLKSLETLVRVGESIGCAEGAAAELGLAADAAAAAAAATEGIVPLDERPWAAEAAADADAADEEAGGADALAADARGIAASAGPASG